VADNSYYLRRKPTAEFNKRMSEVIIKRLKESQSKVILIFLDNGFRFRGKCLNSDESYVEILDFKENKIMVFKISEISNMEVEE